MSWGEGEGRRQGGGEKAGGGEKYGGRLGKAEDKGAIGEWVEEKGSGAGYRGEWEVGEGYWRGRVKGEGGGSGREGKWVGMLVKPGGRACWRRRGLIPSS